MPRKVRSLSRLLAAVVLTSAAASLLTAQEDVGDPLRLSPHHATISVSNMDAESRWYQRVLGFHETTRTRRGPYRLVDHLLITGFRLDLITRTGSVRHQVLPDGQEQGWFNLVFGTSDIAAAYRHLLAEHVDVHVDRNPAGVLEHLTFFDPEGNEVGIAAQE